MTDTLALTDVTKGFQTRTGRIQAVRGVSVTVSAGRVLAFLGPNGAGKSTTIKMAAGLVWPDSGTVSIHGRDLARHHDWATSRLGAVLEGSRNLYWRLTVAENLQYWGAMRRMRANAVRRRTRELLERVGLSDRGRNTVQTLSRGMQQKVALCQALMHEPDVLLLDEPTLGLDFESSEAIKQVVRELAREGTAVLLTTHQLDVAQELADDVAIIRAGQVVLTGSTQSILAQHSMPVVRFQAAAPWPSDVAARLLGLPVTMTGPDTLDVALANPDDPVVYRVMERLAPHPMLRVERHQADLVEVFRQAVAVQNPGQTS